MNTHTLIPILIAAAGVIAAVLIILVVIRMRRRQMLRRKYGPEYEFTLEKAGNPRAVEEILVEREKRIKKLDIRELMNDEKERYFSEWTEIQAGFVDNPAKSIESANRLITEVMIARGFPVADFEQRAADLSVMYPDFVSKYRQAYAILLKSRGNGTATEELRQAVVQYRSLFEELLGPVEAEKVPEKEVVAQ